MAKVSQRFAVSLITALALLLGIAVMAFAQGETPPSGWQEGEVGWQVSGPRLNDPGCVGIYALDVETVVTRYSTFEDAEEARDGARATYWCEQGEAGEPAAPAQPEQAAAQAAPAQRGGAEPGDTIAIVAAEPLDAGQVAGLQATAWQQWMSGGSPIVFSEGQGALNVGGISTLGVELINDIDVTGLNGLIVVLEPWRPGCGSTLAAGVAQTEDPDCNVGSAFLFDDWLTMAQWLDANDWSEGSLWFRPGETLTGTEPVETCVAGLVPPGTALNIVPGERVCPEGFAEPAWVTQAMGRQPAAQTSTEVSPSADNSDLESRMTQLENLFERFLRALGMEE